MGYVHTPSIARWKSHGRLYIIDTIDLFATLSLTLETL